jgi:hypothetical protein
MSASTAADRSPDRASATPRATQTLPIEVAVRRIAGFADLEPDWDSYGGEPSSPVARTEAIRWVEIVADLFRPRAGSAAGPYAVAPLADGGVQIEWRGSRGLVELEVGPDGALGYLFVPEEAADSRSEEADDASWADALRALIRALVG